MPPLPPIAFLTLRQVSQTVSGPDRRFERDSGARSGLPMSRRNPPASDPMVPTSRMQRTSLAVGWQVRQRGRHPSRRGSVAIRSRTLHPCRTTRAQVCAPVAVNAPYMDAGGATDLRSSGAVRTHLASCILSPTSLQARTPALIEHRHVLCRRPPTQPRGLEALATVDPPGDRRRPSRQRVLLRLSPHAQLSRRAVALAGRRRRRGPDDLPGGRDLVDDPGPRRPAGLAGRLRLADPAPGG